MWEFIEKNLIRHGETHLLFERKWNGDWVLTPRCEEHVMGSVSPEEYAIKRRLLTHLEVECALWAHNRQYEG